MPAGRSGVMLALPGGPSPALLAKALREIDSGLVDVVPAHDTLLLVWHEARPRDAEVIALLAEAESVQAASSPRAEIEIPVAYDGPDLAAVAEACGLTEAEVIELHSSAVYEAEFCGFAPGFAYLTGLPAQLHLPRRAEPRTRVPRGSIAIAGPYSGVYPSASPGGWHLLGTTQVRLFDPAAEQPALISPGMLVRFVQ